MRTWNECPRCGAGDGPPWRRNSRDCGCYGLPEFPRARPAAVIEIDGQAVLVPQGQRVRKD